MWKRISAYLFDFILLVIAVAGFAFLLSAVLGFDKHNDALDEAYARYEAEYGVEFKKKKKKYDALDQTQKENYDTAYKALISVG